MGKVDRGKKKVRLGRREDSVPRALSFTLSSASKLPTRPCAKEASAEEREAVVFGGLAFETLMQTHFLLN